MRIMVLGGTGAMGMPLVKALRDVGNEVYVTTRAERKSEDGIYYITGDAHQEDFIKKLLGQGRYDVVIDFMVYGSGELAERLDLLLDNTNHYFFFSSARVYAKSTGLITEESPRLLDVCEDGRYLQTDEYALAKARGEDLLRESKRKNWTIIRPYITYNNQRLQLGVYEKENWLWRALKGRAIVLPKDIASRTTTMTYGPDVAYAVAKLIEKAEGYGETYHITTGECATWSQVLDIYLEAIEQRTGIRPDVIMPEDSRQLQKVWNPAQIRYDRLYDRRFDGIKLEAVCGKIRFKSLRSGLAECLNAFLDYPEWSGMNWRYEAWADRCAGERTPIRDIMGKRNKLRYLKWRYYNGKTI